MQGRDRWGGPDREGEPPLPPVRYGIWSLSVGFVLAILSIVLASVNDHPEGVPTLLTIGTIGSLVGGAMAVVGCLIILANGPRPRW